MSKITAGCNECGANVQLDSVTAYLAWTKNHDDECKGKS